MYGYAFYFESAPNDLTGLPNSDVTYVVLLLCVAIILCIVSVKNQAKKDLLKNWTIYYPINLLEFAYSESTK